MLISTPKKTIIEDNYFSTEMEAILIPVESSHWYESGSASNVLIQNNTFQDCQHSGYKRGVIRLDTDDDNTNLAFRNIEISNNIFNQFDNMIVQIANVDGFKFIGNTISNSGTFPQLFPDAPAFTVDVSKNVVFENNTYGGKAKQLIVTDESSGDIEFK